MVPTYYVSNLARTNVTVAISGDGGDESFAGYEKYSIDLFENRVRQLIPSPFLKAVHGMTLGNEKGILKKMNSLSGSALLDPGTAFYITNTFVSDKLMNDLLTEDIRKEIKSYDPSCHIRKYYNKQKNSDHLSRILYTDLKLYLPGDVLVKVDRMSMANALEVRSPLLDHKVIEFAARIPSNIKMKNGQKKYILKKSFEKILPKDILSRKKHGFDVPLDQWFRNELVDMANQYLILNDEITRFFNRDVIVQLWAAHQSNKANNGTLLWTIFMFSLWMDMVKNRGRSIV
jgi:asparagine synthase (glutamine-hydrolysing)